MRWIQELNLKTKTVKISRTHRDKHFRFTKGFIHTTLKLPPADGGKGVIFKFTIFVFQK